MCARAEYEFNSEGLQHCFFKTYHSSGGLATDYNYVNGKVNGPFLEWFDSGELSITGNYKNDKPEGDVIEYYRNGQIKAKTTYVDGLDDGEYIAYYENGNLTYKGKSSKGKTIGERETFYESGAIMSKVSFDENGKETGVYKEYSEEGWLHLEFTYNKGNIDAYKYYNRDGKVIYEAERKVENCLLNLFIERSSFLPKELILKIIIKTVCGSIMTKMEFCTNRDL
jgi:antitoxin component YwqK of YwqJK toxin-antitoxin module